MIPRIEGFIQRIVPDSQCVDGYISFTEEQLQNYTHAVLLDVLGYVRWYTLERDDIDPHESMLAIHSQVRSYYEIPTWLKGEEK